jgi:hypothetical protein
MESPIRYTFLEWNLLRKLTMPNQQTRNSYWYQAQALVAYLEDGTIQPASGARPSWQGDVLSDTWLIEVKSSENGLTYRVTKDLWDKAEAEALGLGRDPMIYLVLQQQGVLAMVPDWVEDPPSRTFINHRTGTDLSVNLDEEFWESFNDEEVVHLHIGDNTWLAWKAHGPISSREITQLVG